MKDLQIKCISLKCDLLNWLIFFCLVDRKGLFWMIKPIVGVLFKAGVPKGSILVPYFLASVLGSQTLSE